MSSKLCDRSENNNINRAPSSCNWADRVEHGSGAAHLHLSSRAVCHSRARELSRALSVRPLTVLLWRQLDDRAHFSWALVSLLAKSADLSTCLGANSKFEQQQQATRIVSSVRANVNGPLGRASKPAATHKLRPISAPTSARARSARVASSVVMGALV